MGRKKPSMFSKDYQKQMKKRKRRYIVLILACAFFIGGGILYATSMKGRIADNVAVKKEANKNNKESNKNNKESNKNNNETSGEISESKSDSNIDAKSTETKVEKPKEIVVKIENKNVTIEIEDESKNIISFKGDSSIEGDISPNKHNLVLIEKISQNMYIINNDGKVKNITRQEYVSTENEVFTKESVMGYNQGYLWAGTPKFISDDIVIYISYLPWISSEKNQYIWSENINTLENTPYYELVGKNIKIGKIEDKGISINIDGKVVYLNAAGTIVN